MSTFSLEIVTPERVVFRGVVRSVQLPGEQGSFGVLARHAPMIAGLAAGAIRVVHENGDIERIATSGGFAEVRATQVLVLADTAERAKDIDIARVEAAIAQAKARLLEGGASAYEEAQEALKRATARMNVVRQQEGM